MLAEKLKILPTEPGVYLFKNNRGGVIYIGKAINLRNRVKSYFSSGHAASPKTQALVKNIADVEYLLTDSEVEALILESNLIKKHQPKYNIRLTDDKSYPYLRVTLQEEYPRLEITRTLQKDGSRYFGPYTNVGAVQETLKLLKRVFPLRSCRQKQVKKRKRPCLNAHIQRCIAPCQGLVSPEEYRHLIEEVILFLEGKEEKLVQKLKKQMQEAAARLDFEQAAELRDQLLAVEKVREKQKIVSSSFDDFDLLNYVQGRELSCVQIFFVRGGKLMGGDHFLLEGGPEKEGAEILTAFLKQYYYQSRFIPGQILLPEEVEEKEVLQSWLQEKKGGKVVFQVPQRGQKKKLLELAAKNARESLQQETKLRKERQQREKIALAEITQVFNLTESPWRIECYDISNFQGQEAVAAMVVFEEGKPKQSQYRRFKIKTVEGPDDFASMVEVIRRRLQRALRGDERFSALPDLVLIDGGKGQLSAALSVMKELGIKQIPVVALAEEEEMLFYGEGAVPVVLPRDSQGLYLLQRIRNEAHRFAVTYHRLLRGRRNLASVLDDIPGLGPQRKAVLLQQFQFSLTKIRQASLAELQQVKGLGSKTAWQVWNFFHTGEEV
ncbi:MAG TPA: excinuclease ABC subunit UvrC [Clostridia bacterium]|jgi:excinuclease ABC subunit C|nr:excinuclease ABC subunit UvrC [Clostridia bacterium]